jgi:hypothetical protein
VLRADIVDDTLAVHRRAAAEGRRAVVRPRVALARHVIVAVGGVDGVWSRASESAATRAEWGRQVVAV